MPDGLVYLEPDLAAVENQIEAPLGAPIGRVQRYCLFCRSRRLIQQGQFLDQLIAFQLVLAAERVRIRSFLNLVFAETEGFKSGAAEGAGLIDHASERRNEDLAVSMKDHRRLSECDPGIAAQLRIHGQEQSKLFLHAHRKWIDAARRG